MTIDVHIQRISHQADQPDDESFTHWINLAADAVNQANAECVIRITDSDEIQQLNWQYRHINRPTNVLAFPADLPKDIPASWLGDLVLAGDVVAQQARSQHKALVSHWAHLTLHGFLHLVGFDHQTDSQAHAMETLEINLMQQLGYDNPYQEKCHVGA